MISFYSSAGTGIAKNKFEILSNLEENCQGINIVSKLILSYMHILVESILIKIYQLDYL